MKKTIVCLAALLLLLSLTACRKTEERSYNLYYLRSSDTVLFGEADAIVAPVKRQISGQSAGLTYLMQLYFEGPTEEGFHSPFPQGTRLIHAQLEDNLLVLEVTAQFSQLENIRLTLAGACLAATCHELTGAETVQVICGEETYHFNRSDYTFLDVIDTQSGKDTQ